MTAIVTRCGYRCDLCPAYKENVGGSEDQQRVSDGWFKYYGFRIPPEGICCDGCWADDSTDPKRIDTDCPVRPCVIERGLDNCAQCDDHVCDKLRQRLVDAQDVVAGQSESVPPAEYGAFIRPYDNARRLEEMRGE